MSMYQPCLSRNLANRRTMQLFKLAHHETCQTGLLPNITSFKTMERNIPAKVLFADMEEVYLVEHSCSTCLLSISKWVYVLCAMLPANFNEIKRHGWHCDESAKARLPPSRIYLYGDPLKIKLGRAKIQTAFWHTAQSIRVPHFYAFGICMREAVEEQNYSRCTTTNKAKVCADTAWSTQNNLINYKTNSFKFNTSSGINFSKENFCTKGFIFYIK